MYLQVSQSRTVELPISQLRAGVRLPHSASTVSVVSDAEVNRTDIHTTAKRRKAVALHALQVDLFERSETSCLGRALSAHLTKTRKASHSQSVGSLLGSRKA